MNVLSEEIIPDTKAKEILESREKEGELKYEQKNALDVLRKFVKFDPEKIANLLKELKKVEKLRDRHLVAIANFLPEDRDDLRAVLHKDYTTLTDEEIKLILETVKKFI